MTKLQGPIIALLIDLDDTLFDERAYVESGFRHVATVLSEQDLALADRIFAFMVKQLDKAGRGRIFDDTLDQFGLTAWQNKVPDLVQAYRHHKPDIAMYPRVRETLDRLKRRWRLGLVTDGTPIMQKRKVEALALENDFEAIVYCWEIEAPKPSPDGFLQAMAQLNADPQGTIIIGDNPTHDMDAARRIGCQSIRVRTGRYRDQPCDHATVQIEAFAGLPAVLEPVSA